MNAMPLPPSPSSLRGPALRGWLAGLALVGALGLACGSAAAAGKKPYSYYVTGNADAPVQITTPPTTPSVVLMGGGPDVDQAFRWMISRAGVQPGTGGRFVVIRATGTDAYDPYIFYSDASNTVSTTWADGWVGGASLGLSSVETLVIPSTAAANDPFVNNVVAQAQAVFIAGGDQSDYIKYWKGTALDRTLQNLMARNVPIGGTSAGLAVLGQFDYAALKGTVTSTQALDDPFNRYMTLDPNPLSLTGGFLAPSILANTIVDAHLDARDRMGRLITFVARLVAPASGTGCAGGILSAGLPATTAARGIGVDVETALLVQGNGSQQPVTARRVTNPSTTTTSAVYFVRPLNPPTQCAAGKPLTMTTVELRKLADNTVFNLTDWTGVNAYYVDAIGGTLTSDPY
ncbi:MAG: cyanophycinase [Acidobacteriota bacterium]